MEHLMDYLPYQRLVKEADAVSADWETLRGAVEEVVSHRLAGEHEAAERILNFDLPRRVAVLADGYSTAECESRLEALFRDEYSLAAIRRTLESTVRALAVPNRSQTLPFPLKGPASLEQSAPASFGARRAYREPKDNDIASMIDDMLSGNPT